MGTIRAVCTSETKGIQKRERERVELRPDWGIGDDAHAGAWHRQVSLLAYEKVADFKARGADVDNGAFGENLVVEGIDLRNLPLGTRLRSGEVELELTQIGKECHARCAIYHQMGDCIMPREGVFCRVITGGTLAPGDPLDGISRARHDAAAARRAHHLPRCRPRRASTTANSPSGWENARIMASIDGFATSAGAFPPKSRGLPPRRKEATWENANTRHAPVKAEVANPSSLAAKRVFSCPARRTPPSSRPTRRQEGGACPHPPPPASRLARPRATRARARPT